MDNCLWRVGQTGIILEVCGAFYLVFAAFKGRKHVEPLQPTLEGLDHIDKVKDVIQSQANTELVGFGLLGIGLIMQFIGGFA